MLRGVRAGASTHTMPAAELVRYCAHCDLDRQGAIESAESDAERADAERENPRRVAKKTDIDGTPLCKRCFEYRRADRQVDYFEQQLETLPPVLTQADAAFEAIAKRLKNG